MYTRESYEKSLRTIIEKYKEKNPGITDEEALALHHIDLKQRASTGGKNGKTKGFAHGLVDPAEAGRIKREK